LLKIINNNKKRSNKYIYIPLERIKGGKIKLMEKNIQTYLVQDNKYGMALHIKQVDA
jgi:hypothetical protein